MENVLGFSSPLVTDDYLRRHRISSFENSQWSVINPLPFELIAQPAPQKEMIIEMEEYNGFDLSDWGEIKVTYNKDRYSFLYNFKYVCLNKQTHNEYYPDKYLYICFDLELEGSGDTKEAALNDLFQLLNIFFDRSREISETPEEFVKNISTNIDVENAWKQSFTRTYKRAYKLNVINDDYIYQIT